MCRSNESESRLHDLIRFDPYVVLVVPEMGDARGLAEICSDTGRLERFRFRSYHVRKIRKSLDALLFLRLAQNAQVDTSRAERFTIDLADAKDAAHPGVRHLHVIDGVLLGLLDGDIDVEHELR